jgi:hypothetical protein
MGLGRVSASAFTVLSVTAMGATSGACARSPDAQVGTSESASSPGITLTTGQYVTTDAVTNGHYAMVGSSYSSPDFTGFSLGLLNDAFGHTAPGWLALTDLSCPSDQTWCGVTDFPTDVAGDNNPLASQRYTLTVLSPVCFTLAWAPPWLGTGAFPSNNYYDLDAPDQPFSIPFSATYCTNATPPAPPPYQPPCQGPSEFPPGSSEGCGPGNPGCNVSPLVLNFGTGPIAFTGKPVPFDWYGDGTAPFVDWIGPQFGILALDPGGTGNITSGAQLFGTQTPLSDGTLAANGFAALAQYDADDNGVINWLDPVFANLVLWFDLNSNGVSDPGEIFSLKSQSVYAFYLADHSVDDDTDATGSYVGLDGTFGWYLSSSANTASAFEQSAVSVTGELGDVYLAVRAPAAPVVDAGATGSDAGSADATAEQDAGAADGG